VIRVSELAEEVYPIAATTSAEQREEAAGPEVDKKAVELEPVSALALADVVADRSLEVNSEDVGEVAIGEADEDAAHKEGVEELLNNKELYKFLVSSVIDGDKKKTILKTLAEDVQFSDVTLSFLNLLVDKRRTELINEVVKEFKEIYNEITDTEVANVISTVKIEKPQLALIAKKIQSMSGAKNVRIKNIVDESLIAGFIVQSKAEDVGDSAKDTADDLKRDVQKGVDRISN
jgi:F-type H+-transporting ATPase subunit delta